MKDLLQTLCDCLSQNKTVAIATVVKEAGSTPRGAGSKMLVDASGLLAGTIGGGLAEGMALNACFQAIVSGQASLLEFCMDGSLAAQSTMICGGHLWVLIEPVCPEDIAVFHTAMTAANGRGGILFSSFHVGEAKKISAEAKIQLIQGGIKRNFCALADCGKHQEAEDYAPAEWDFRKKSMELFCEDRLEGALLWQNGTSACFAEALNEPHRLIIAGGGHVSLATAQIASIAGFEVTVLDDRPEFAQPQRFPSASSVLYVPSFTDCFQSLNPSRHSYIIIVTRGHLHDKVVLAQALKTEAGYIGMIGSTRKRDSIFDALRAEGVAEEQLRQVYSPIGLPIHAETPEEIAVSIISECISVRRGRNIH